MNLADPAAPPEAFEHQIRSMPPDIVAFSVTNPSRWPAIGLARKARTLLPDAAIVFGGPAATFLASHLLEICPEIDFIVKGEGEMTFLELVRVLAGGEGSKALEKIHGLVFERSGEIVETPDRELITDLDALPHPSQYFVFQHLAMSRGCPGSCTFCGSAGFWKNRAVRSHSAAWFAAEIEQLHQNGVRHFYISDDTFTMDRGQVLALCSMIRKKNLQITWNAISRADYVDEELLEAMRTAGCIQISYGVESGSEKIRKTLGKPISNEKVKQAFSMTRACGILPRAYFIYGSPGETDQTIRESMDLLLEIQPLSAVFYMLAVFPGTALYRQALRKNRVSETVWEEKIEDLPWFETDPELDFNTVKAFGDRLRDCFYSNLDTFVANIRLKDTRELSPLSCGFSLQTCHDILSWRICRGQPGKPAGNHCPGSFSKSPLPCAGCQGVSRACHAGAETAPI